MRAPLRGARILLLYVEMNSRRVLAAGVSLIVGLVMEAEHACEDVIREGLDLEVVVIDGLVEFAAGVFDAIFRPGNVGLEVLELLGGTKIGVGFGHRHQAAERALQLGLRALILTEGSGVVDVDLHGRGACAGGDDFLEGGFLEVGGAFDGVDDTVIQIGTSLVLGLYIAPGLVYRLVGSDQSIVAAAGATAKKKDDK